MNLLGILIACAVCFGDPSANQTRGQNAGILTLLAITGGVLICMAGLFATFIWRARRAPQPIQPSIG
jgi:heme/copper-type cytochrome/quinol oxidase subunit 2